MKLIDLLVKELPNRGGWPEAAVCAAQDKDGEVCFSAGSVPEFGYAAWEGGDWCGNEFHTILAKDYAAAIITREQYEAALSASEGWIEWHGGECPVDSDAIVEVKYLSPKPYQYSNDRAGDFDWEHIGSNADIIAYRLHDQGINSRTNDDQLEQDLNECIGQDLGPAWSGNGMPPVGAICEAKVPRSITGWEWRKVKVVESGIPGAEKEVLVYDLETTFPSWADEFRPLRADAEKAREAAEAAMRTCLSGTGAGITPLAAKGIYDAIAAGKIPGVKLEGK